MYEQTTTEYIKKETEVMDELTRAAAPLRSWFGPRFGLFLLGCISFAESALPIPLVTDPFLMAAILNDRSRTYTFVWVTTITSVLGGLAAFLMAEFFFDLLLSLMGEQLAGELQGIVNMANQTSTLMLTLIGAVTPVPYTISAWAVAVLHGNVFLFVLASLIGRGGRYVVVGYLTRTFGDLATRYIRKYLGLLSVVLILVGVSYAVWHFWA